MKKLVTLCILTLSITLFGLWFTTVLASVDPLDATKYDVGDGNILEIAGDIPFTYYEDFNRLQIVPQDTDLIFDITGTDWMHFNDTSFEAVINDALTFGSIPDGSYWFNTSISIVYGSANTSPLTDYYNTLSIYFKDGEEFRFTITETSIALQINIEFGVEYQVESENLTQMDTGFEIENVAGHLIDGGSELLNGLGDDEYFQIYLSYIPEVNDQTFINNVWVGFGIETLATGLDFTQNYYVKYVNKYIAPFARTSAHLTASLNTYINYMQSAGIFIELPTHTSLAIMAPVNWLNGIGYWNDLNREAQNIRISAPDLIWEGTYDVVGGGFQLNGEIWSDTIKYTVDLSQDYIYSLLDEDDNTIPAVFGIFLDVDYYVISFNTSGGSTVPNQIMGKFGNVITPISPTRANYQFLGWKQCPYTQMGCTGIVTDYDYFQYLNVSTEIITSRLLLNLFFVNIERDTSFVAIWSPIWRTVTLELNGGIRKAIPNFNFNMLIMEYGNVVADNFYNVPFTNMVERPNYTLEGWYLTPNLLTAVFNPTVPITENITIYAKWVPKENVNEPEPLEDILNTFNINDFVGYFLIYIVALIILFVIYSYMAIPVIVYLITLVGLSGLWIWLGWFNFYISFIIGILIIILLLVFMRRSE